MEKIEKKISKREPIIILLCFGILNFILGFLFDGKLNYNFNNNTYDNFLDYKIYGYVIFTIVLGGLFSYKYYKTLINEIYPKILGFIIMYVNIISLILISRTIFEYLFVSDCGESGGCFPGADKGFSLHITHTGLQICSIFMLIIILVYNNTKIYRIKFLNYIVVVFIAFMILFREIFGRIYLHFITNFPNG